MTIWMNRLNIAGRCKSVKKINLSSNPSPCVQACGIDGDNTSHYWLEVNGVPTKRTKNASGKPPYAVPTMASIRAVESSGYARHRVVASVFAGGGGSSLGWRMAGFRVAWACEFAERPAEAYRLNMNPETVLDTRDVRGVSARDVLAAAGLREGELDVLDGSPPCQTFSTAGKRNMADARSNLFAEFSRLLRGLRPRAFVAENVSGLVKGAAKGMFKLILRDLRSCGYRVSARVLDAQWLGVPQVRKRVIFVGAREDLGREPAHPAPLPYRYSVADACPGLSGTREGHGNAGVIMKFNEGPCGTVRTTDQGQKFAVPSDPDASIEGTCLDGPASRISPGETSRRYFQLQRAHPDRPSPTIVRCGGGRGTASVIHPTERRKFTIPELQRVCSFPNDYDFGSLTYAQRWAVMGNSVPPLMMRAVARTVGDEVLA